MSPPPARGASDYLLSLVSYEASYEVFHEVSHEVSHEAAPVSLIFGIDHVDPSHVSMNARVLRTLEDAFEVARP